jgi:hypothetical protein
VKLSKHLTLLLISHFDLEIPMEEVGHVEIFGTTLNQKPEAETS